MLMKFFYEACQISMSAISCLALVSHSHQIGKILSWWEFFVVDFSSVKGIVGFRT